jgi:hypothetical protein|nr:MAG TPA: hypothetical protein [Caudoviricetes sp.]
MSAEVITAALSLVGTLVGTLVGIALSSNLTNYRIEQMEKKTEKHNNLISRTYELERSIPCRTSRDSRRRFCATRRSRRFW